MCCLQAAKARLLHSEPAAGAVGLTMVLQRLQQQGGHVALHLRHLNPHVASIFQVSSVGCQPQLSVEPAGWVNREQVLDPHFAFSHL